jgi:hypothetical protein
LLTMRAQKVNTSTFLSTSVQTTVFAFSSRLFARPFGRIRQETSISESLESPETTWNHLKPKCEYKSEALDKETCAYQIMILVSSVLTENLRSFSELRVSSLNASVQLQSNKSNWN